MLLFQKRFHAGLVDGSITLTFRQWNKPRVKPGGRYRCHPIGVLEVDQIRPITVLEITQEDARRAGFDSRENLIDYLGQLQPLDETRAIFRVDLHHAGDGDRVATALEDHLSAQDIEQIRARLKGFDDRAEKPWTTRVLSLIEKYPRVAASKLAARVGEQTVPFKARVVKLKKLGLTQSFEVGYEISPRGRAYLDGARKKRRPGRSRVAG